MHVICNRIVDSQKPGQRRPQPEHDSAVHLCHGCHVHIGCNIQIHLLIAHNKSLARQFIGQLTRIAPEMVCDSPLDSLSATSILLNFFNSDLSPQILEERIDLSPDYESAHSQRALSTATCLQSIAGYSHTAIESDPTDSILYPVCCISPASIVEPAETPVEGGSAR